MYPFKGETERTLSRLLYMGPALDKTLQNITVNKTGCLEPTENISLLHNPYCQ
jgi:hypothetical protein